LLHAESEAAADIIARATGHPVTYPLPDLCRVHQPDDDACGETDLCPDYGGAEDGFGSVFSDSDGGL
jgi:hypothetical protein